MGTAKRQLLPRRSCRLFGDAISLYYEVYRYNASWESQQDGEDGSNVLLVINDQSGVAIDGVKNTHGEKRGGYYYLGYLPKEAGRIHGVNIRAINRLTLVRCAE